MRRVILRELRWRLLDLCRGAFWVARVEVVRACSAPPSERERPHWMEPENHSAAKDCVRSGFPSCGPGAGTEATTYEFFFTSETIRQPAGVDTSVGYVSRRRALALDPVPRE